MDLTTLTDDALTEHLNAVLAEQERRANLERIPEEITRLRDTYTQCGGNAADLP